MHMLIVILSLIVNLSFADSALEQLNSSNPFAVTSNNTLTILVYPARKSLNWDTPGKLIRTVVSNTVMGDKHPLSHLDVYLRCEGEVPILSGMSRVKTWKTYEDILWRGQSLELLTSVFPGYLRSGEQIMSYLKPAIQNGNVRGITFSLNAKNCQRLLGYYRDYTKRKYFERYSGFTSNVFAGEGAGCAAFGISFLKVADVLTPVMSEAWTRTLSVPERLLPRDRSAPSAWSYLFGLDEAWARDKEPAVSLLIYDPEKIYDWIYEQSHWRFVSPVQSRITIVENAIELTIDGHEKDPRDDYWLYKWPQ